MDGGARIKGISVIQSKSTLANQEIAPLHPYPPPSPSVPPLTNSDPEIVKSSTVVHHITMLQQLNFPSTSAPLKTPPFSINHSHTFLPLSFHSTTTTTTKPKSTTTTPHLLSPTLTPPPPPTLHHYGATTDDHHADFHEKALYLDSIGIDSLTVLSRDPTVLASTSLLDLKTLSNYLTSLGFSSSDLHRIASMCPTILSLRIRDAASVTSFLIREAKVTPSNLRRVLHRRPRLLISPVSSRLRPTLYFLQSIGLHDVSRHTDLLSCSVEDKFLPRIDYFQKLGFSYRDSISMFRRFPPLFCYSVEANFEPKFNYFVVEMGRELKELRDFPQYFSFSLDNRIKPRHQLCVDKGVYFPLSVMLNTRHHQFHRRLGFSVDTSLPLMDSPLWSTTTYHSSSDDDDDDDDDDANITTLELELELVL